MTMLDQPWQIYLFGLLQVKHRLRLEIKGFKFNRTSHGTTLQVANHVMGTSFRSKQAALDEFTERFDNMKEAFGLAASDPGSDVG